MKLNQLTATELLPQLKSGQITAEAVVRDCIARIHQRDDEVEAFQFVDESGAIQQAHACDRLHKEGTSAGLLHGIPVAIKDMIYTSDMPTQHNSPLYEGNWPHYDAACVKMLQNAGAVILGKAHTVEFASMGQVAPTRNPHDPNRTPGGSSSGSAAAVADYMVPMALGTQTGGSTIRPASFCGIYGMKPTFGTVPIEGVRPYAPSMDTVGLMARSVADIALLAQALQVIDRPLEETNKNSGYRIGLFRTSLWSQASEATQHAVEQAAEKLRQTGIKVIEIVSGVDFAELNEMHNILMHGEGRRTFFAELGRDADRMHPDTRGEAENTLGITGADMRRAYDAVANFRVQIEREMEGFDAWLTPSVVGEAPEGLASTGEALFNRGWSALHTPCITVPSHRGPNSMPVGVQLVAPRFEDYRLLQVAAVVSGVLGV